MSPAERRELLRQRRALLETMSPEERAAEMKEVEAQIINVDRKNRIINLSIKAKESTDERASIKAHKRQETEAMPSATIGDLIRAQMESTDR